MIFTNRFLPIALLLLSSTVGVASAQYVLPSLGGDQETPATGASMKHALIGFDGTNLTVHLDETVLTPVLRELSAHSFDPTKPWSVLTGKAYNAQQGWNIDGTWAPPAGLAVWIEEVSSSSGLEVYQGGMYMSPMMIEMQTFDPIFGTDASSNRWQWGGTMTHNAYAVLDPSAASYEATYNVYLGDAITGTASPLYGSDTVTFRFIGVPEPTSVLLIAMTTVGFTFVSHRS